MSLDLWNELGGIPLYHLDIYCQLLNNFTSIPSDIDFSNSENKSPKLSPEELANTFLIQAVKLCSKPFLKKYSSDEITAQSLGIKCFDQLSFLLQNNQQILIQKGICESICSFYVSNFKQKDLTKEYQHVSSEFCQNVIIESTVLTSILESIILQLENQGDELLETETYSSIKYKLNVIHTLLTFKSTTSIDFDNKKRQIHCELIPNYYKTCNFLLKQVYKKMESFNDSRSRVENGEMVGTIVDILFEVLCEQTSINDSTSNLNNDTQVQEDIINSLFKIFLNYTKNCSSSKQKKRRNDLLMLFTIFVENNAEYFVSSGSIEILLNFAIQPERYPLNPKFKLKITSSNEDFEFKKLTWLFINKISIFPAALQSISENKILSIFFHFITTPKVDQSQTDFQKSKQEIFGNFSKSMSNQSLKNKCLQPWRSAQKFELESLALDCLCNLTPILLQDFMECFGVTKLIQFLQFCLKDQKTNNCDRLKSTLKVVRQIVVLDCEPINEEFVDQGIVQMIVLELTKRQNVASKVDIDIKQDLLFILAVICEYSVERKDILGMTGVNLFIQYLNICVNGLHINEKNSIPNSEQILIVYVVDCLWACISGANTTEKMFIESSGIYLLLDALERANKAIYPILLGAICELSDNEMALSHIVSWKSSINGKTNSMELFLNIWHQVENIQNFESDQSQNKNHVINTIFETPHAKIYTLCEKLQHEKFDKKLSKNHQITLLSVKNYLDSKILDSWMTVGQQLQEIDKIEPVHCDCEFLNAVAEEKMKKSVTLNRNKMELQEKIDQESRLKEQQIYKSTKLAYFSLESKHKRWQKKLKTTSNYKQLIKASNDRMTMLEESRKFQNLDKIDCQNIVKHELVYPLKNNTTSHSKSLAIDT